MNINKFYKELFENKKYQFLTIVVLILIVYFRSLSFGFVYCDDHELILKKDSPINNIYNFKDEVLKGYYGTNYYRPIITLSLMLDYSIYGENPYG